MKRIDLMFGFLFFVTTCAAADPIYKWVDQNGVTQYSAKPPSNLNSQKIQAQSTSTFKPDGNQPTQKSWQDLKQELDQRRIKEQVAQDKDEEKNKSVALEKKQRCTRAKSQLNTLQKSGLYITNAEGKKEWMDQKLHAAETEKYTNEAKENCGF